MDIPHLALCVYFRSDGLYHALLAMNISPIPFKKMIFVCTNSREGESACANLERGVNSGLELIGPLREELKKRGLKGKIRVARSGCMDLCGKGPNLMVFDEKGDYTLYSKVSHLDIPNLIEKHFTQV